MNNQWLSCTLRDEIVDYIQYWHKRASFPVSFFIKKIGISKSKFYNWKKRYGKDNQHNAPTPRAHWLTEDEKIKIIDYFILNPLEGYRRLSYMMLDNNIVAVSPSSVYRVLNRAKLIDNRQFKQSKKGTGFIQPLKPHKHWHIDITYININGTFYYMCGILDGFSRFIVHWEINISMAEEDIEIIIQQAKEKYPSASPRIISDNGPQFIANDFKEFIRVNGMTHVKTSPYYPQSNGKYERFNRTIKTECIRPKAPASLKDARTIVTDYVEKYNTVRLHSAIGYITPASMLAGKQEEIFMARKKKLKEALKKRKKAA